MCMSSTGTTTSNSVQKFEPPSYTVQPWEDLVNNASGLSAQGLPIYTGQTVAPISQQAQIGGNMLTGLATQGSPVTNAAQTQLQGTLQGEFSNPYATAGNPYIGDNPYINSLVDQSNKKITDQFARGTAAQTDAAAAREGAYGGSGWEEAQGVNARNLADALAQNTSGLLGQNYYNSANLAEQGLNRATGAVENERNRSLQAAGLAPTFDQNSLQQIQAMIGAGDINTNYQQQLLGADQGLFNQYAQAPWTLSDLLGNVLSRASGGQGTSSSSYYQGMNPWQTAAGLGAAGYGLFGGGK